MYEFITIGGGSYFVDIFNGIASLVKAEDYLDSVKLTGVIAFIWVLLNAAFSNNLESVAKWFITAFLITHVLLVPKTTLHITDKTNPALEGATVDNVPFVVAYVASASSKIGHLLTRQFEAVYSLPDDIKYQENGMIFGVNMVETMATATIYNSKFSETLDGFIRNCIFYDLMLDNYSFDDLKSATDIWALITPLQSENRFFTYVSDDSAAAEYPSCKDGVVKLESDWNTKELAEWKNPLSKKINFFSSSFTFGRSKEALQKQVLGTLVKSSDAVSDYLMGVSLNSSQLLKQAMTNNAILAATENYEAEFNQQQFQNVRVQVQTRSAYQTIGKQAGQWLPMVKIIIESVFYGLFPIIVLLAIIPNMTLTVLKGYFFTFFWLASWGPIYAILNRGITEYAGNKMTDGVALSLINQQNIQTITADISAMAGYFAMFVPLIAAALAKGGVAAMSSMSTAFMSVAQGAAMQATNEGVTGNLSFGNVGLNSRHAYSGITMQNDAGMMTNHHNDGSTSISRGTAESDTGYNVHASDRLENIASQSIAQETSLAQSKGSQSQQFESKGFESMIQNHRNIESSNQFSENFSAEERESFRKSQTAINDFATTHNISNGKSAEIFGGISAGMPFGIRGGITSSDQKVYEEAQKYSSDHNLSQDLNTAKQAMQSNHLNFTDSQGQSINDNFNKSAQLSKEQSTHLENAQRYSDQKQFITTNSASIDKTYDQEFYNYVKSNLADGNVSKATELFNPNDPNRHSLLDKSASEFLEDKFHKTNISENFDQDYKYQATQFLNQNSPKNLMSSEPSVQFDKEFQRIDNSALSDSTQNNYQETQDSINNMKMGNNLMGSDIYGEVKNKQDAGITGGLTLADEDDVKRAFEKKDD